MSGHRPLRAILAVVAAAIAALACASPALASRTQESVFQDDRLLTNEGPAAQARALDSLAALGVDTVHTVVNWRRFAPQADMKTAPEGFDGSNPAAYGPEAWDTYDSLVRGAQARGIQVLMSPSGPIPDWASGCGSNVNRACKPNAKLYGQFVRALATRYSGAYADENQGGGALPRVARWSVWNEPNLGSWLYPQSRRVKGGRRQWVGAAYYRRLVAAARKALDATGHRRDQFLVGETAPLGSGPTRMAPGPFLRLLFCQDGRGKRLRGRVAKQQGCAKQKRIRMSGLAHHPYTRGAGIPSARKERNGLITMATIDRLLPIVRGARRSPVAKRALPVYLTEFGVSTEPPDVKFGVPLLRQAQYLNKVDYAAFVRPWIKSSAQYQLHDDTGLAVRGTFQTGLMFGDGAAKPSLQAYRMPIHVVRVKRRTTIFGQVRPARSTRPTVEIQNRPRGATEWTTVVTRRAGKRGFVFVKLKSRSGSWRLRWAEPNGAISYSRGSESIPAPVVTHPVSVAVELRGDLVFGPASGRVTSSPPGIDCAGGTCEAPYAAGTAVTLTATPGQGTEFSGWGGACSGTGPCTVTVSEARSVTATFTRTGL